jgi:hypothetical protein
MFLNFGGLGSTTTGVLDYGIVIFTPLIFKANYLETCSYTPSTHTHFGIVPIGKNCGRGGQTNLQRGIFQGRAYFFPIKKNLTSAALYCSVLLGSMDNLKTCNLNTAPRRRRRQLLGCFKCGRGAAAQLNGCCYCVRATAQ